MPTRDLVERYAAGADAPGKAISGLSRAELNATPIPNTWSIQQIILHLMDSDLIASDRMKRIIAEENPTIIGFDETAFSNRLFYDQLDAAMACDVFRQNRLLTATILRNLSEAAFSRRGTHNERGPVTLLDLVQTYVGHLDHHLGFVYEKRKLLGK